MELIREVLKLRRENGRSITADASGPRVALIVWRKNTSPLLPLVLDLDEAERLRELLQAAIEKAST
jgi:hypothetical protein